MTDLLISQAVEERLDRINLMEYLAPTAPAEKVLFARIIQDAANSYLYAFIGRNGATAEEFFASHQYFFKVVSTEKATWDHHRSITNTFTRKGEKVKEVRHLTDEELQLMCFDRHYENSGLSDYIHIDKFRNKIKNRRRSILQANWEQVSKHIRSLYEHELSMITDGNQVPLQIWNEDLLEILVDPPTPNHLANVLYVPTKAKRPKRFRKPKPMSESEGIALASKITAEKPPLGDDWGPLSTLLNGASNAEADSNTSSDYTCGDPVGSGATA